MFVTQVHETNGDRKPGISATDDRIIPHVRDRWDILFHAYRIT